MKDEALGKERSSRLVLDALPFFSLPFYRLLAKTLHIKWMFFRRGGKKYSEYLTEYYSRANNPYWEVIEDKWAPVRSSMVELAELKPGETVLDLATGVGFQAAAFAARSHFTVGMDYIFDRTLLARKRHPQAILSWVVADASNLPFRENAFDVVAVSLALHDMPVPVMKHALGEIYRVARRRVVIVEPQAPGHPLLRLLYLGIAVVFDELIWIKDYLENDLQALLAEARLKLVVRQQCFHNILTLYSCDPV